MIHESCEIDIAHHINELRIYFFDCFIQYTVGDSILHVRTLYTRFAYMINKYIEIILKNSRMNILIIVIL